MGQALLRGALTLIVVLVHAAGIAHAQNPSERVNLVLGGGGAKGFVHVGVLQFLASHGIAVESIVATSSGAIVGSLYAYLRDIQGLPPEAAVAQLTKWCLEENFSEFLDPPSPWQRAADALMGKPGTVYRGEALGRWLQKKFGDTRVSQLKRPVIITATDRLSGQEFLFAARSTIELLEATERAFGVAGRLGGSWSQEGATTAVHNAVHASTSIQGYFPPKNLDGRSFWDGGNSGALRIDLGWRLNPKITTVGISLTYKVAPTQADKLPEILLHTINILTAKIEAVQQQATALARQRGGGEAPRILIVTPSVVAADRQVGTLDFALTSEERKQLITNGYEAMRQYFDPGTRQFRDTGF